MYTTIYKCVHKLNAYIILLQLVWDPKYLRLLSMPTEATKEAFTPKRTPVTSPE